MSDPTQAERIDPILANVYLRNQHEIARQDAIDVAGASDEAWRNPDNLTAIGVDEETATMVARGITSSIAATREPIKELADIFTASRLQRLDELEKQFIKDARRPAIAKNFKSSGRVRVEHITKEQHRIALGLNGQPQGTEQQVA
ncbi:MAG: hypothetical protein AAB624_00445 [Patescibacteria group bacterium]